MYRKSKTLIVGTTPDYIELIYEAYKDNVIFLNTPFTESSLHTVSTKEYLCDISDDLSNINTTFKKLDNYLNEKNITINGISTFDCESLELASMIADKYKLPFPSSNTISICRNKDLLKRLMHQHAINVPKTTRIDTLKSLLIFLDNMNGKCVLKPAAGSGSELVFKIETKQEAKAAYTLTCNTLKSKHSSLLYNSLYGTGKPIIIAEELIDGTEYSCDYYCQNGTIHIIRITEKLKSNDSPFGTILGYKLIKTIPGVCLDKLKELLLKSSTILGIENTICMIDFIVKNNDMYVLEITPRPGGDCLPPLLLHASGENIINMNIDLSSKKRIHSKNINTINQFIAFRIFARNEGILKNIDISKLADNPNIVNIHLYRKPGDTIELPPRNYESWNLGYIILKELRSTNWIEEYKYIIDQIEIDIE